MPRRHSGSAGPEKSGLPCSTVTLQRRVNASVGWSQWYVGGSFYESVEEAVLACLTSEGAEGLRMPYARWREVYRWLERGGSSLPAGEASQTSRICRADAPWVGVLSRLSGSELKTIGSLARAYGWKGAPDIILEGEGKLTFVEVKSGGDALSSAQRGWARGLLATGLPYLLVQVQKDTVGEEVSRDDFIHETVRDSIRRYVAVRNGSHTSNGLSLFAFVRDSLCGVGKQDMVLALQLESRLHALYGGRHRHRLMRLFEEASGASSA